MRKTTTVLLIAAQGLLLASASALAQSSAATAQDRPTAAEKRCLAATRRVDRQKEVIAQAEARTAKERSARDACRTRRQCESLDRALKAAEARRLRYDKQLAHFDAEARSACAGIAEATVRAPAR